MNDLVLVTVVERRQYLLDDVGRVIFRKVLLFTDFVK